MSKDIREIIDGVENVAELKKDNIIKFINKSYMVKNTFDGDTNIISRGLLVVSPVDITQPPSEEIKVGSLVRNSDKDDDTLYTCQLVEGRKVWIKKGGFGGGGLVDSVNGKAGAVILSVSDLLSAVYTEPASTPPTNCQLGDIYAQKREGVNVYDFFIETEKSE